MTQFLTSENLPAVVDDLGVGPVEDLGLLGAAAHRPTTTSWAHEAYPTLDHKAAALLESLMGHHPLVDDTKRLGCPATVVFLDSNDVWPEAPDDDAYDLVVAVADGFRDIDAVAHALARWP